MKHLILLSLLTLHFSLFILSASAGIPLKWTVETSRAVPAQFEAYQGETLALEAALQSYGKPLEAPSNYSLYWQTNGMGNAWWSQEVVGFSGSGTIEGSNSSVPLPTTTTTNVLFATWSPTNDVGAKVYNCFIGQPGTIYHAAFQLRLRPSPGALPNELPLPTPVIDFANVTVLNPPWSGGGGGGGVDTNAVIDIVHKTVDGSARTLPPYLHYLEMDDTYPEASAEWYAQADYSHGSCSAVREGNTLSRNYDWTFDFMPEFVVRCVATAPSPSCPDGRFASLAVCNVGTNLTESDVVSGKWSRWYKALPGHAVDGINENGVVAEINVVGGNPQTSGWRNMCDIHPLGAVRWALDNGKSAEDAATNLAARITFPSGLTQNFHYMVADDRETWIVENGTASNVTEVAAKRVMTNFPILNDDYDGEGMERYALLRGGANITNAWWTLAYLPETSPIRYSDLGTNYESIWERWAEKPRETHRGESSGGQTWWQTVHTSVYDITNRTLRIAVQEQDDWYVFAVPSAGGGGGGVDTNTVREIVRPMIGSATNGIPEQLAALQSGKRDLTDEGCYNISYTQWAVGTSESERLRRSFEASSFQPTYMQELGGWGLYNGVQDADDSSLMWYCGYDVYPGGPDILSIDARWNLFGIEEGKRLTLTRNESTSPDASHVLARRSATAASALAKFDADGNLVVDDSGKGLSSNDYTDADKAEVAKVKDKADEFIEWEFTPPLREDYEFDLFDGGWAPSYKGEMSPIGDRKGNSESTELSWPEDGWMGAYAFTATRRRVLRTGDAATPQELTDAISTNNPAFVSAVRSVSPPSSTFLRVFDDVRQCWWIGRMVNGVINWEVE